MLKNLNTYGKFGPWFIALGKGESNGYWGIELSLGDMVIQMPIIYLGGVPSSSNRTKIKTNSTLRNSSNI